MKVPKQTLQDQLCSDLRSCSTLRDGCVQLARQKSDFLSKVAKGVDHDSGPRADLEPVESEVAPEYLDLIYNIQLPGLCFSSGSWIRLHLGTAQATLQGTVWLKP